LQRKGFALFIATRHQVIIMSNAAQPAGFLGSPTWTSEDPSIPAVYRVAINDNGRWREEISGCNIHAYWDGVDTWSASTTQGVRDARRRKMLQPGVKPYQWMGDPL
jgi:hypothetical protein